MVAARKNEERGMAIYNTIPGSDEANYHPRSHAPAELTHDSADLHNPCSL